MDGAYTKRLAYKEPYMPNPLTGYDSSSGDSSGIGGRVRETKVMKAVDDAAGSNGKAHPAATPSSPTNTRPPARPSSFAPSEDDDKPRNRVYGSPIEGNAASK